MSLLQPVVNSTLRVHHRLLPRDEWIGWTPYLWLSFLAFYFVNFSAGTSGVPPVTRTDLFINVIGLLIFLCLYFRYYWHKTKEKPWLIAAVAFLGYVFYLIPPFNGYVFIIYASAFCGFLGTIRKGFTALIIINVLFAIEGLLIHWLHKVPNISWDYGVFLAVIIGLSNIYFGELSRKNKALKQSEDEIRRLATTAERERIGRDLHDLLGHTLTVITVKAELAAKLAERDLVGAAREIREVERISRDTLQQVREAVGGYRSGGLTGEIINARIALGTANISLETSGEFFKLPASHDQLLALVLREATTNVVRHSEARNCSIRTETANGVAHLYITDDGRGGYFKEGHGIRGMRERLQIMNGRLDIRSQALGTVLHASLPIEPLARSSVERIPPATTAPIIL